MCSFCPGLRQKKANEKREEEAKLPGCRSCRVDKVEFLKGCVPNLCHSAFFSGIHFKLSFLRGDVSWDMFGRMVQRGVG